MSASLLIGSTIALWQAAQGQPRVKSTLGTMDFAGAIGLIVPVLLVKSFDREASPWIRCLSVVSLVAALIALVFNGTRAVWVAVVVSFLLFAFLNLLVNWRKGGKVAVVTIAILAAVVLLALSSATFTDRIRGSTLQSKSIHSRLVAWEYAWHEFQDHWFLGRGLATLPTFSETAERGPDGRKPYGHVHNNILQMLAENGLVGGLAFIFLFFSIITTAFRRLKEPATRNWATIALLCTVDFLVHGMFDYTFTIATIMYSYWFILGLAYSSFRQTSQQRR
jgi:O-antigen ligase